MPPLPFSRNQMQKNVRKIVNKASNPRACELRWGTVATAGAGTVTLGNVNAPVLWCYIDGQGNSGTSLGNSIATNAQPVPVAQLTTEVFVPGERIVLLKVGANSRTMGSQFIAIGKLPNQANNVATSGNVEITATGIITLLDYNPITPGLYQANLYLRTSASTTCIAVGQSYDENGYAPWYFQVYTGTNSVGWLDGITLAAHTSYTCVPMTLRTVGGAAVQIYIDCGTANVVYASWSVIPIGAH